MKKSNNVAKKPTSVVVEGLKSVLDYKISEDTRKILTGSSELSESDASGLVTLFESAVRATVLKSSKEISKVYRSAFKRQLAESQAKTVKNVSAYLETVVDEWLKENAVPLARSIADKRNALIVKGIQESMTRNYVPTRGSSADVLKAVVKKAVGFRKTALEESKHRKMLEMKLKGMKCEQIFGSLSEGLAKSEIEKFMQLVEGLNVSNVAEFRKRATEIRKLAFQNKPMTEKKVAPPASKTVVKESKGSVLGKYLDPIQEAARILGN